MGEGTTSFEQLFQTFYGTSYRSPFAINDYYENKKWKEENVYTRELLFEKEIKSTVIVGNFIKYNDTTSNFHSMVLGFDVAINRGYME